MAVKKADVYELLRRTATTKGLARTSLLGRVPYTIENGDLIGHVPQWLRQEAAAEGLEIIGACPASGQYLLVSRLPR